MPETKTPTFIKVPAGSRPTRCNGPRCGAMIYFVHNPVSGRMVPVTCDVDGGKRPSESKERGQLDAFSSGEALVYDGRGVSHFTDCPDADRFSRGPR